MYQLNATIAQLVERDVANVEVAGSTPASRSKNYFGRLVEWYTQEI